MMMKFFARTDSYSPFVRLKLLLCRDASLIPLRLFTSDSKMKLSSIQFLALLATCSFCCHAFADSPNDFEFEAPVVLKAGDSVLNSNGKLRYPSPAIFDVDGDGKDELVIGTIFGELVACENENNSGGEPVWAEPIPIKSTDGKSLDLNNW